MNIPILKTKIHCPSPPSKLVRRPLLMQKLNEGLESGKEITLVSAPAGFGKTTCISEWIQSLDLPVAWLSLDPSDDDPGRFLLYLIVALQTIDPTIGQQIETVIRAGQMPPNDIVSATIINGILECDRQFLLILDDFHTIHDNNIFEILKNFLANHPGHIHLVFITREDPPLPLARLRANNKLTEIRAKDLRFTGNDIDAFLKDVMGMKLSMKDIAALEEKTEGWIAGVQLAGISFKDKENPSQLISKLSGSHRFIAGYLTEQVLNHQPKEIREFLFQTAILDKFNSDLCNAVTGCPDSNDLLNHLHNANLFLVPLDDEFQWYRYHHFFVDLLRELKTRDETENLKDLHRRASQWYAEAGMVSEAVGHALDAEDYTMAMDLLENHASSMLMQGYAKTVNNWMQTIPDEWRSKSPQTNLAFAWVHLLRGAYSDLTQYIDYIEPQLDEIRNSSLKAEWLVMKSLILYMDGEIDACMGKVSEALELVQDQNNRVLGLAHYVQAHIFLLRDDYNKAMDTFQKSIQHSRVAKSLVIEIMCTISLINAAFERGKLQQAYMTATQTISWLESSDELHPISSFVYLALGDMYYQWNRIKEGSRAATRAFQLSSLGGLNTGLVTCRILFSRLFQIKNNLNSAEIEIQSAVDLLPLEAPEYLRQHVAAQQASVYIDQNQLDPAISIIRSHGIIFDEVYSSPDIFPDQADLFSVGRLYNCLLRTLLHDDQDSARLTPGIELAKRIIAEADRKNQFLISLEAILLRAQLHEKLGNLQSCTADMIAALKKGQPENLIGIFIEQRKPVADLLRKLIDNDQLGTIDREYVKGILAAFPLERSQDHGFETLADPLTERELDVMLLMSEGLKYKEIAAKLFISLNTVRYHVKAIYGKLNVNNRTQAIEKARKRQIL